MLKPLFRLPQKTNLKFVKYFKLCFGLSIFAILGTVVLLSTVGLNFNIDFKGGTRIDIETQGDADLASLRSKFSSLDLGEVSLQNYGDKSNRVILRYATQDGGPDAQQAASRRVESNLPAGAKIVATNIVGSTVSGELVQSAIWALVVTNIMIFIYVWFRFEWQFALGAIVSLIHDVMFTIGVFSAFHLDFDLSIVAALLTILGYSINDTVVIYDRIRENLRRYKRMPLGEILDLSVNETMSRTVMTVGTVLMALIALYWLGGETIRGFTFAMLFGVVIGTYSSVFIAAPFLVLIGVKRDWSGVEKAKTVKRPGAASREAARLQGTDEDDEVDPGAEAALAARTASARPLAPARPNQPAASNKYRAKQRSGGKRKRR